jgi:hypothetical protein
MKGTLVFRGSYARLSWVQAASGWNGTFARRARGLELDFSLELDAEHLREAMSAGIDLDMVIRYQHPTEGRAACLSGGLPFWRMIGDRFGVYLGDPDTAPEARLAFALVTAR